MGGPLSRNGKCTLVILVIFFCQPYAQTPLTGRRAWVRVTLNAAYQNTDDTASQIKFLATHIPPYLVDAPPGNSISVFVARQYGFGKANGLDKVYAAFAKAILPLNGIEKPSDWEAGKRSVPTLPHCAKTNFN